MEKVRRYDLDALRGVMMILGIVLHSSASFVEYPILDLWPYKFLKTHLFFDAIQIIIHLFRIPVFFIIAGYFMSLQIARYGIQKVALKRLKRIVIPFLFGLLILAPWINYGFAILSYDQDWTGFDGVFNYSIFFIPGTVHFWFLYYLIFYNLAHLFYEILESRFDLRRSYDPKTIYVVFFIVQLFILNIFGVESIHGDYHFLPALGTILYFGGYYFFGIWTYRHHTTFIELSKLSPTRWIGMNFFVIAYLLFRHFENYFHQFLYWHFAEATLTIVAIFSLILVTFGVFRYFFSIERTWISFIAKASYTIYMVHLPIVVWLLLYLEKMVSNPFVFFGLLVALTSFIAGMIYYLKTKLFGSN